MSQTERSIWPGIWSWLQEILYFHEKSPGFYSKLWTDAALLENFPCFNLFLRKSRIDVHLFNRGGLWHLSLFKACLPPLFLILTLWLLWNLHETILHIHIISRLLPCRSLFLSTYFALKSFICGAYPCMSSIYFRSISPIHLDAKAKFN